MTKKIINVAVGKPELFTANGWLSASRKSVRITERECVDFGRVDFLVEQLQEYQKRYSDYQNLSLQSETDCGCYNECQCEPTYYLYGERLETDVEYEFRLALEAERKARLEEHERKEYEKLKAKFEEF